MGYGFDDFRDVQKKVQDRIRYTKNGFTSPTKKFKPDNLKKPNNRKIKKKSNPFDDSFVGSDPNDGPTAQLDPKNSGIYQSAMAESRSRNFSLERTSAPPSQNYTSGGVGGFNPYRNGNYGHQNSLQKSSLVGGSSRSKNPFED